MNRLDEAEATVSKKLYRVHGVSNSLWNEDLAQTPREERRWSAGRYLAIWVALSGSVPAYLLASGLVVAGMSRLEALGTILLGSLIVLGVTVLSGAAGARYGIPFPVFVRASFGVVGAQIPLVLRAIVACGWFGIQSWVGGMALFAALRIVVPEWVNPGAEWYCFAAFWFANVVFSQSSERVTRIVRLVSAVLLLILGGALVFWIAKRGGWPELLKPASIVPLSGSGEPWRLFLSSLTGVIGFWTAVSVCVADLARRGSSQRTVGVGEAAGLLGGTMLYTSIAIVVTAGSVALSHRAIWNPIQLVVSFPQPVLSVVGLVVVMLATLSVDITGSPAAPARVFSNLGRNVLSVRAGGLIAGLIGFLWMPWRLVADPERYLHGWLIGISGVLGPIAGVMIADYFVVRRRALDVEGLYVREGPYEYAGGYNPKALVALGTGIGVVLVGLVVPRLHWLYDGAWFAGLGAAALVYVLLMTGPPEVALNPPTPLLIPMQGFEAEGA